MQKRPGPAVGRARAIGRISSQNPSGLAPLRDHRNTPTLYGASHKLEQFHDKRAKSLFDQCLMPVTNKVEMGMQSLGQMVGKIASIPGYPPLFVAAFGSGQVTADRMRVALVAFISTIQSIDAPADRLAAFGRFEESEVDNVAQLMDVSPEAVRGWLIFSTRGYACTQYADIDCWPGDRPGYVPTPVSACAPTPSTRDRGRQSIT